MSITLDHVTGSQGLTFSHTVGAGTHSYLLVQANLAGSSVSVTSVTYGAAPLARLVRDTTGNTIELWGLQDPVAGTATVTITLSGGAGNSCAAMSFFGADPILISATGHLAGSSNTASVTITGQAADLIVCGLVSSAGTPTGGETSLWNDGSGDAACSVPATGGSQAVSYSLGSVLSWAVAAVSLHEDPPVIVVNTKLDLASIRAGIAQILSAIPEITSVEPYARPGVAANDMPVAMILRESFTGPDIHEADTELGKFDANLVWTIRVYANLTDISEAQELHDTLTTRLTSGFDGSMLIDANGPGVVDESRITYISPFVQEEDHPAVWITEATLKTFNVFTP